MRMQLLAVPVFMLAAACGPGSAGEQTADGTAPAAAVRPGEGASFRATFTGAVEGEYAGDEALSDVVYERYNIALVGGEPGNAIVISFVRDGVTSPAPGTFVLGADGGFEAHLDVYHTAQREFDVAFGELQITRVTGGVVTGNFSFTAHELLEDAAYGTTGPEVRVQGSFVTRPVE
jgi:hypothetical protein